MKRCRNSQKSLTGKGMTNAQKGTLSAKERNPFSFSSDRRSDNTKIFLAAGVSPSAAVFRRHAV